MTSGGVVVLPAIAGLNDYIGKRVAALEARRFAVETVDYYGPSGPPDLSTPERIGAAVATLDGRAIVEGARAAVARLQARGVERVGVLGFCIGGTYAMLAGSGVETVSAVVNYYGSVPPALDRIGELNAPMIAHYGTEDRFVPCGEVDALERALRESGKIYELFRYGGAPHAFDEDFRAAYRPVAAREAWTRSLVFLDWYLKGIA